MKHVMLWLLLAAAVSKCYALSETELTAISALYNEWPPLRLQTPPWTANVSEACNDPPFSGLECSVEGESHVTSLVLVNVELSASIPDAIGGLEWLEDFQIWNGGMKGSIPDSISGLKSLRILRLAELGSMQPFYLSGGIPPTIGELVNLEELILISPSMTSGTIPEEIKFCKKIKKIQLSSPWLYPVVTFTGTIPSGLCELEELQGLSLSNTGLKGIDKCQNSWQKLEVLDLSYMLQETSFFPGILVNRYLLRYLDVSGTPFRGELGMLAHPHLEIFNAAFTPIKGFIKEELWGLTNLVNLDLSGTRLFGSISPKIAQLKNLTNLNLSSKRISGPIPPELGECSNLVSLRLSDTEISGTIPPEISNLSELEILDFSYSQLGGVLPESFSRLTKLKKLSLSSCQFISTIPNAWTNLNHLQILQLKFNRLVGTIPDFGSNFDELDLSSNYFEGSIPSRLLNKTQNLRLAQNQLSGTISSSLALNKKIYHFDVSSNKLNGSLPAFSPSLERGPKILVLSFSHNDFSGRIPPQYMELNVVEWHMANNRLEGFFTPLIAPGSIAKVIDIRSNGFESHLRTPTSKELKILQVSSNKFVGTIPVMPGSLEELDASHNSLYGDFTHLLSPTSRLRILDLSHNSFGGPLPDLWRSSLRILSLANNQFQGPVNTYADDKKNPAVVLGTLESLDISSNRLIGVFPSKRLVFGQLTTLRISNNQFFGHLDLNELSKLTVLDAATNELSFDAAEFNSRSQLVSVNIHNNSLYGTLSLSGMTSLRFADFSNNELEFPINFQSIGTLFTQFELEVLSISGNPALAPLEDLDSKKTLLNRTTSISPSSLLIGVNCFQMTFGDRTDARFIYDESLFAYQQCICDDTHYGAPPEFCFDCPALGTSPSNCSGPHWSINPHHFVYDATDGELTSSKHPIGVESCFPGNFEFGASNCLGLGIEFSKRGTKVLSYQTGVEQASGQNTAFIPTQSQLQSQCRQGSSGRLCARCDCESESHCFFAGAGNVCLKCSRVFKASTSVPVTLLLLFVIFAILTVVFFFVLKSKRSIKDEKWENLSLPKKVIYRLIYLTSIGHITVLVTFVQVLVEVTDLEMLALRAWLRLVNGEGEAIGLRCIFPFLANPMNFMLSKLMMPFAVAGLTAASILMAEFCHRLFEAWRIRKQSSESDSDEDSPLIPDSGDDMGTSLLQTAETEFEKESPRVEYPATALVTSVSISIIRFFYFGSTMSAHEYLFSDIQELTRKKFVQSVPWMAYSDAHALRGVSIPFILLFLVALPLAFVILCWKLRHKVSSPKVRLYFGSLFENFQSRSYWWEIVNIFRKIAIALVLRSLGPLDAFQPSLIVFILGSLLIATAITKPWKNFWVNVFDSIGSLLLVLSMGISQLSSFSHFSPAHITILVLDLAFAVSCVIIIAYETVNGETEYQKQWKARFGDSVEISPFERLEPEYGPPLLNIDVNVTSESDS